MEGQQEQEQRIVDTLEHTERYMQASARLHKHLKAGWMNIAQARYSLGSTRVTRMQYDQEMQALSTVNRVPGGEESSSDSLFKLHVESPRARSVGSLSEGCKTDPVTWFAGLPPYTLRMAQKDFQAALDEVIVAATEAWRIRTATSSSSAARSPPAELGDAGSDASSRSAEEMLAALSLPSTQDE